MSLSKANSSGATATKNRISDVAPQSGICAVCLDGCGGGCEVFMSSLRGREVIYPQPFGKVTAGATKDYPVDLSHFNIMGTAVGAVGVKADSDVAVFPAVNIQNEIGNKKKIKLKVPIVTGALGSTEIARVNWEPMAIGAALAGVIIVVGENVCGMDPQSEIKNGRVVNSPEMARRVKVFKDWYQGYGEILVQHNVEDYRLGLMPYVIEKLGVDAVEIKWGQGAKDIGGEVKLPSLDRAKQLKSRGYLVFPDPDNHAIQEAFRVGEIKEFERHSRLGMVDEDDFHKEVADLRKLGAQFISLKTGAYRPADLARAIKFASDAKLDLLTVDGAGGGTGMSPWRMMNEWGVPTVYIESLLYKYAKQLAAQKRYVPPLAVGGGLSLEDHMFKVIAMGAPFIKAVLMGRATMIPAMVGKNIENWLKEGQKLPKDISRHGEKPEEFYALYETMKAKLGKDFSKLPLGAIGMYSYLDRLAVGLQQLMAGARKFSLEHITRDDLVALTQEAADVSGITYIMDSDAKEVEKILSGKVSGKAKGRKSSAA